MSEEEKAGALDALIARMVEDYLSQNDAARVVRDSLDDVGVGFWPVMDHLTIRTTDIDAIRIIVIDSRTPMIPGTTYTALRTAGL